MSKNHFIMGALSGLMIFIAGVALAEPPAIKIAFVDVSRAFNEYPATQEATKNLNEELAERKSTIEERQTEIADLKEKLRTGLLLSETEKEKRRGAIERKTEELKKYFEESQKYLGEKEEALTKRLMKKVYDIITQVAEAKKIAIVLDKSSPSFVYGIPELDITEEVISLLGEKKSGVGEKKSGEGEKKSGVGEKKSGEGKVKK
ncbi:MAG: OmpH family outer membrane protein [bacterium]|nr:OmpH family outer membrane protein [bacterium]